MVRGTRLAWSATRARAHRASRHRLRLTLRPSLIHAPQDCINARRRRGERHGRRAGALARAAAPPRAFASSGTALHCSRPHGRRRQRFWFRRSARLRRCGGRGDLVGQDDDAAAGDACADAACADARLAMLPRPHLRLSRPKPWGPHRPTRSCEAPDARRALGGGCEGLPELSVCHGRACRAVLSGFDTLELLMVLVKKTLPSKINQKALRQGRCRWETLTPG